MNYKTTLKKTIKTALVISTATTSMLAFAQDTAKLRFKTEKISDSIYMLSGQNGFTGGNIGLSIGSDGVAMIDNGVGGVISLLKTEIARLTEQPIDYMINTHIHGDHTGNNAIFANDGATILSHKNLREALAKDQKNGSSAALPVLTFSERMTLHINGDAAQIIHFKNAHTDGDAVVYFRQENVLHAGDILFNQIFPYIDAGNGGSLDGVIDALEHIAAMVDDDTKIIPGHGPLANRAAILATLAMLKTAKAAVGELVAAGKTDAEILAARPLAAFESYSWNFITTEKMTQQILVAFR